MSSQKACSGCEPRYYNWEGCQSGTPLGAVFLHTTPPLQSAGTVESRCKSSHTASSCWWKGLAGEAGSLAQRSAASLHPGEGHLCPSISVWNKFRRGLSRHSINMHTLYCEGYTAYIDFYFSYFMDIITGKISPLKKVTLRYSLVSNNILITCRVSHTMSYQ